MLHKCDFLTLEQEESYKANDQILRSNSARQASQTESQGTNIECQSGHVGLITISLGGKSRASNSMHQPAGRLSAAVPKAIEICSLACRGNGRMDACADWIVAAGCSLCRETHIRSSAGIELVCFLFITCLPPLLPSSSLSIFSSALEYHLFISQFILTA